MLPRTKTVRNLNVNIYFDFHYRGVKKRGPTAPPCVARVAFTFVYSLLQRQLIEFSPIWVKCRLDGRLKNRFGPEPVC